MVESGRALLSVNFRKFAVRDGCAVLLFFDDIFQMGKVSRDFSSRIISLPYEIVKDGLYSVPSSRLWELFSEIHVRRLSTMEWRLANYLWAQINWIIRTVKSPNRDEMLKSIFYSLLLAIDSINVYANPRFSGSENRKLEIVVNFFRLLPNHCKETRDVKFYAKKLNITSSYLYKICREILRSSPKAMIDKQTVCEIKYFLAQTDLSVKNISDELNFEDPSYLCRYFRREMGMSPLEYRNNSNKY